MLRRRGVVVALAAVAVLAALLVPASGTVGAAPAAGEPGLRDLGAAIPTTPLRVGAAVALPSLADPAYVELLGEQFAVTTPTNHLKWELVHPGPTTYDFTGADATLAVADAAGMQMRGHVLVWHRQNPAWLTEGTWTREQAIELLRDHIDTVVGRYAGRIHEWDVVNEAFLSDGSLRPTFWLSTIGPDYLRLAFEMAHEADPTATLFYNDFGAEATNAKSDAILALVEDLRADGVPIHGVGFQFHLGYASSDFQRNQWITNLQRFADAGVEVAITELDVGIPLPVTDAKLEAQAATYVRAYDACLAVTTCDEVIVWGFTDRDSWIPHEFPGRGAACLYDTDLATKPAHDAVRDRLAALAAPGLAPAVQGIARGPGGAPAPGLVVTAVDADSRHVVATARTGRYGRYLLPALPPGAHLLRITDPTGALARTWWPAAPTARGATPVGLDPGAVTTVDWTLVAAPPGAVAGRVQAGDGTPVAGRTVWIHERSAGFVATTRSGPDGWYRVGSLPTGQYTAVATDPAGIAPPRWHPASPTAPGAAWVAVDATVAWAGIVATP